MIKALAGGAVATAQGGFTSSGHVVDIVDATDAGRDDQRSVRPLAQGHVVSDQEREKAPVLGASDRTTLERRATTNPELLAMYERSTGGQAADGIDAWGQTRNYSRDDVQAVKQGSGSACSGGLMSTVEWADRGINSGTRSPAGHG